MSVSNCSACSAQAQTAPITGVVTEKNKSTGAAELSGVQGLSAPTASVPAAAAALVNATLDAVFRAEVAPLPASASAAAAYTR